MAFRKSRFSEIARELNFANDDIAYFAGINYRDFLRICLNFANFFPRKLITRNLITSKINYFKGTRVTEGGGKFVERKRLCLYFLSVTNFR